jgi:hypothetical protein
MSDRFYTMELVGYDDDLASGKSSKWSQGGGTLHVYVFDRAYCHRLVAAYRQVPHSNNSLIWPRLREQAAAECARLNAWHEAAMRA